MLHSERVECQWHNVRHLEANEHVLEVHGNKEEDGRPPPCAKCCLRWRCARGDGAGRQLGPLGQDQVCQKGDDVTKEALCQKAENAEK